MPSLLPTTKKSTCSKQKIQKGKFRAIFPGVGLISKRKLPGLLKKLIFYHKSSHLFMYFGHIGTHWHKTCFSYTPSQCLFQAPAKRLFYVFLVGDNHFHIFRVRISPILLIEAENRHYLKTW